MRPCDDVSPGACGGSFASFDSRKWFAGGCLENVRSGPVRSRSERDSSVLLRVLPHVSNFDVSIRLCDLTDCS